MNRVAAGLLAAIWLDHAASAQTGPPQPDTVPSASAQTGPPQPDTVPSASAHTSPPQPDIIPADEAVSLLDSKVQKLDHKVIGSVTNLIVKDGAPVAAIIELTGYMGVGNRSTIVPWGALKFDPGGDPAKITADLVQEQIHELSKIKTADILKPQPPTPGEPQADAGALKLIDSPVIGSAGKSFGTVADLLVDRSGNPRAVIVAFGGTLDPHASEIALGWSGISFKIADGNPSVTTNLTAEQAKALEPYKNGKPAVATTPAPAQAPAPAPSASAEPAK